MKLRLMTAMGALMVLSACSGDVGKVIGLDKQAPDEFVVMTREPLVLPPDFGLRPPSSDQKRIEEDKARDLAEATLFGSQSVSERRATLQELAQDFRGGELAMLVKTEAVGTQSDIRELVDLETTDLAQANDSFVNELMFWKNIEDGVVVDAEAESERLNENSTLGRTVTDGDTPMIIRDGEGSLF